MIFKLVAAAALVQALASISGAQGHSVILEFEGTGGPKGRGLGVDPKARRDGTSQEFQKDSTFFSTFDLTTLNCGFTAASSTPTKIPEGIAKNIRDFGGMPQIEPGKPVKMKIHQVNLDGAGPYACQISEDLETFSDKRLQITKNVPGKNGLSTKQKPLDPNVRGPQTVRFEGEMTTHAVEAVIPGGIKCRGGQAGNQCIVMCNNPRQFGGCVPVQMGGGGGGGDGGSVGGKPGDLEGADNGAAEQKTSGGGDKAGKAATAIVGEGGGAGAGGKVSRRARGGSGARPTREPAGDDENHGLNSGQLQVRSTSSPDGAMTATTTRRTITRRVISV